MKKDKAPGKEPSKKTWLLVFVLIAAFSLIFFDYRPEKIKLLTQHFHAFIQEKQNSAHEKIVEVKEIAAKEKTVEQAQEKPREIHFEFYTVLPRMRVALPETDKPLAVIKSVPEVRHPQGAISNLFDPGRLQNDLKEEFASSQQYVVQTGVFKYVAGAEKIHQALLKTGVPVRVVKIRMARGKAYSVQAGPFASKEEAKSIQQQLKKKSINGIIRKL